VRIAATSPLWLSEMTSYVLQSAGPQTAQELRPERLRLAVADHQPEDFSVAAGRDARGDDHRLRDDPVVHPRFAVGRVQEDVGEHGVVQRPFLERGQFFVEFAADPRHLRLGDPGVGAQRFDQVIDRTGGHSVDVGLHHHREQGPVDAAPAFEQ